MIVISLPTYGPLCCSAFSLSGDVCWQFPLCMPRPADMSGALSLARPSLAACSGGNHGSRADKSLHSSSVRLILVHALLGCPGSTSFPSPSPRVCTQSLSHLGRGGACSGQSVGTRACALPYSCLDPSPCSTCVRACCIACRGSCELTLTHLTATGGASVVSMDGRIRPSSRQCRATHSDPCALMWLNRDWESMTRASSSSRFSHQCSVNVNESQHNLRGRTNRPYCGLVH